MKNGRIDKYLFEGGYAQASVAGSTTDNFAFFYYNRDHLGSIREVVDANGNIRQVTNYYPFGTPYADSPVNPDHQPYKYNGKELDRMHGLDTYDYGARQHDPILARWDRMDPLCEKNPDITPYHYCHNNPVVRIDPNGKADYFTTSGTFINSDNNKKDPYIYIKTKSGNVRLANYTFSKNESGLRSMMRVAFHYGKSVGIATNKTSIGVDAGMPKGLDKNTLAYSTNDHHIRLMVKDGHFKEEMSQIYNMRSTLRHESIHEEGERDKKDSEVKTLIQEINNPEFNKTTASFQESTLGSLQDELVELYANDIKLFNNVINEARDILESRGMNGTPIFHDGGNSISF